LTNTVARDGASTIFVAMNWENPACFMAGITSPGEGLRLVDMDLQVRLAGN
jgi:hypothetical protein